MAEQTRQLKKYVRETEKIAQTAKVSADAAKTSADIAARVSVPTLAVEHFELVMGGTAPLTGLHSAS